MEIKQKAIQSLYKGSNTVKLSDKEKIAIPESAFMDAIEHLHKQKGYTPPMLADKPIRKLIKDTHTVLQSAVKTGIADNVIPEPMRRHLDNDTFLFSGHKVHTALEQANLKLRNENGTIKSFDQFKQEVLKIDKEYNQHYLQAEHQFAIASSQSAANWAKIEADGDRYNLRYRTTGDSAVRESHRNLDNTVLPPSDPFWQSYTPPNGWSCRCQAIQVRKSKYETSDPQIAAENGEKATTQIGKNGENRAAIFRFNPGAMEKIFPPRHPYYKAPKEVTEVVKSIIKEDTASERKKFMQESSHLLDTRIKKTIIHDGKSESIGVEFDKRGLKHLFNDKFRNGLSTDDLLTIDTLLKNSKNAKIVQLYKERKDNIQDFVYFDTVINGVDFVIHVGRRVRMLNIGKTDVQYTVYSINKKNH